MHIGINRIIPYPPSFNKIAARIIEPSNGASTWAFGSHRCVMNMGIFTKNAIIMNIIIGYFNIIMMDNVKDKFIHRIILINNGNEAVIV